MISHKNKIIEDKVMEHLNSPTSENIDFSAYYPPSPPTVTCVGHKRPVMSVAVFPNNNVLSGSHDKTIKVWDISNGKCLATLFGHTWPVSSVAVLSDTRVISASGELLRRSCYLLG